MSGCGCVSETSLGARLSHLMIYILYLNIEYCICICFASGVRLLIHVRHVRIVAMFYGNKMRFLRDPKVKGEQQIRR